MEKSKLLEKLKREKVIKSYILELDTLLWNIYVGKNAKGVKFGIKLSREAVADMKPEQIKDIISRYEKRNKEDASTRTPDTNSN